MRIIPLPVIESQGKEAKLTDKRIRQSRWKPIKLHKFYHSCHTHTDTHWNTYFRYYSL